MTPKQRQALELAQYAFRNGKAGDRAEAMVAIDAVLAQRQCDRCGKVNPAEIHTCTPLRRPLTHNDLCEILDEWNDADEMMIDLCRRIEAAHGITGEA